MASRRSRKVQPHHSMSRRYLAEAKRFAKGSCRQNLAVCQFQGRSGPRKDAEGFAEGLRGKLFFFFLRHTNSNRRGPTAHRIAFLGSLLKGWCKQSPPTALSQ